MDYQITIDGVQYVTVEQCARALGVNNMTVYRKIKSGKLPARRERGEYLISRADFDAMIPKWPFAEPQAIEA